MGEKHEVLGGVGAGDTVEGVRQGDIAAEEHIAPRQQKPHHKLQLRQWLEQHHPHAAQKAQGQPPGGAAALLQRPEEQYAAHQQLHGEFGAVQKIRQSNHRPTPP